MPELPVAAEGATWRGLATTTLAVQGQAATVICGDGLSGYAARSTAAAAQRDATASLSSIGTSSAEIGNSPA